MANIADFIKQAGTFLKAEDVKNAPIAAFAITGEAEVVMNEKYNTERLHIPGQFLNQDVVFDCSKTNARVISEKLGEDTSKWKGKSLQLEVYKTKTSDGKLVDAINVKQVNGV